MKDLVHSLTLIVLWFGLAARAGATISHSGVEMTFRYEMTFRSLSRKSMTPEKIYEAAHFHAEHLFGLFYAKEGAKEAGYNMDFVDGFGGPTHPEIDDAVALKVGADPYLWVTYKAHGRVILLRGLYDKWFQGQSRGVKTFYLLKDLPAIYSDDGQRFRSSEWKPCGDEHYSAATDFSYFYDSFRCPKLGREPIAVGVLFSMERTSSLEEERAYSVPLDRIRGDNNNGKLTTIYFVNGFDSIPVSGSAKNIIHRDQGWKSYKYVDDMMLENGFERARSKAEFEEMLGEDVGGIDLLGNPVTLEHDLQRRYLSTYVKMTPQQTFVVRSGLFNAENEKGSTAPKSFPKFWKEAWENGDIIYFGGHSGDGQSLDLGNLLSTLEKADVDAITFPSGKTQIAVLDSCSSYAHYQMTYASKNPQLNLVTFGFVSLFHLAQSTMRGLTDLALDTKSQDLKWVDALHNIEQEQLNGHVKFMYEGSAAQEKALKNLQAKGYYPISLMSVHSEDRNIH
jgi:hypothetical protein